MEQKPVKVLQVIADFKKGGVQADVMYPARILGKDQVNIDVMLLSNTIGFYEDEFSNYGDIYRIPLQRKKTKIGRFLSIYSNFFYIKKEMDKFFVEHPNYDAVEARHLLLNAPCIWAAKQAGVPVRIAHCHVNKPERKEFADRLYVRMYLWVCAQILNRCCTLRFGVTKNALTYMFGNTDGVVVKNPTVDLEKFNPDKYPQFASDDINLIVVGSYSARKNQKFAAEVFFELHKLYPKSRLTFIGYRRSATETYLDELQSYIEIKGLNEFVDFLPQDSDVPKELSRSTYMLIPSLQEGLPNVALEAQAMGVPCFLSTDVSEDCNCGICRFIPLSDGPEKWAKQILQYTNENGTAKHYIDMSDWDNKKVCAEYLKIWKGNLSEEELKKDNGKTNG